MKYRHSFHAGNFADVHKHAVLVALLQALERNRWLSASLGKNGRQYVRDNYDWRNVGRKYHDLLTQLKNNHTGGEAPAAPSWRRRRSARGS